MAEIISMVGIISVAVHAPPPKKNPESAPAPRPDQLLGLLKTGQIILAVISDLVSVQIIVSLGR